MTPYFAFLSDGLGAQEWGREKSGFLYTWGVGRQVGMEPPDHLRGAICGNLMRLQNVKLVCARYSTKVLSGTIISISVFFLANMEDLQEPFG